MGALPARYCGWPIRETPLLCWQFISLQLSSGSAGTLSQRVSPGSGSIKLDNFLLAVSRDSAT